MYAGLWPAVVKGKEPPAVKPEALHDLPVGSIVGIVGRGARAFLHRASTGWTEDPVRPSNRDRIGYGYPNSRPPEAYIDLLPTFDGTVYLLRVGARSVANLREWNAALAGPGALMPQAKKRGAPLAHMPAWTPADMVKRIGWIAADEPKLDEWSAKAGHMRHIEKAIERGLWAALSRGVDLETMTLIEWCRHAANVRGMRLWETEDNVSQFDIGREFPDAKPGDVVVTSVGMGRASVYLMGRDKAVSTFSDPLCVAKYRTTVGTSDRASDAVRMSAGYPARDELRKAEEARRAKSARIATDRATWQAVYDAAPGRETVAEAAASGAVVIEIKPRAYEGDQFELWGMPKKARGHNYDVTGGVPGVWVLRASPGNTTQVRTYPNRAALHAALVEHYAGDKSMIPVESSVLRATRILAGR